MDAWQPIDSAPWDGTYVLLGDANYGTVCEGRFIEPHGWYAVNNDPSDTWGGELLPTHWMPLPAPPNA